MCANGGAGGAKRIHPYTDDDEVPSGANGTKFKTLTECQEECSTEFNSAANKCVHLCHRHPMFFSLVYEYKNMGYTATDLYYVLLLYNLYRCILV